MGFFEEDLIITNVIYRIAVIIAVLRWVLSCAYRFRNRNSSSSSGQHSSSSSSPSVSSQMIKDNLQLTSFRDFKQRRMIMKMQEEEDDSDCDTCAVCLSHFKDEDLVRELRNCCHVFHRECIDRWVDYDHHHLDDENQNHKSCPLCRATLLTSSQQRINCWPPKNEPSWAVERILYLFGDDLLI